MSAGNSMPPGWYPDPYRPGGRRWWDGTTWTNQDDADPPPQPSPPQPLSPEPGPPADRSGRSRTGLGIGLVVLGLGLVAAAAAAFFLLRGDDPEPVVERDDPETTLGHAEVADLARSVVQIVALDANDEPVWTGSGTVISEDGLVLTNGHVVDDRSGDYDRLAVAVTAEADQPPELTYVAEVAAVDYALDLAVIELAGALEGNEASVELPPISLGDSDAVEIGDEIQVLGFPGIGGETITFTEGAVSGFVSERDIGDRAWIKTDATITGGNSGGLAADAQGQIIGVPTIAGDVDCRPVQDTNGDNAIDELDTCVPIGGFINGLRPIALAMPLIDAAEAGEAYESPYQEEEVPEEAFDPSSVTFSNLVFAPEVDDDDQPTEVVSTLPSGTTELCAVWDYEGMADGVSWDSLWLVNGEASEALSSPGQTWVGGTSGSWWVCIFDEAGLADGLYEVTLFVEEETITADAIYVGGDHPPVDFTLKNALDSPICYVRISPSEAQNWGQDRLGSSEVIDPGASKVFTVPASVYDLLLQDCELTTLREEFGVDLSSGGEYTAQ